MNDDILYVLPLPIMSGSECYVVYPLPWAERENEPDSMLNCHHASTTHTSHVIANDI